MLFFLNCPCQQQCNHCAEGTVLPRCHLAQLVCELTLHNGTHHNARIIPLIFHCTDEGWINECHHMLGVPSRHDPCCLCKSRNEAVIPPEDGLAAKVPPDSPSRSAKSYREKCGPSEGTTDISL